MTGCSSHVLDAEAGMPAVGLPAVLTTATGVVMRAATDADGRIAWPKDLEPGEHSIEFSTGDWFASAGREFFHSRVVVDFITDAARDHVHVALLLGPYSFTTYRGS